jgi:predicted restriction endonuclease
VRGWENGWFHLEGLRPVELAPFLGQTATSEAELANVLSEVASGGEFDPTSLEDERKKVLASIVRRQGQPAFRQALLIAYEGRCAISACSAAQALEAAHIVPFTGPSTNSVTNGLLLRSDIHTLFDLRLLSVSPSDKTVWVSPLLDGTEYEKFRGTKLRLPRHTGEMPSPTALSEHWKAAGLAS